MNEEDYNKLEQENEPWCSLAKELLNEEDAQCAPTPYEKSLVGKRLRRPLTLWITVSRLAAACLVGVMIGWLLPLMEKTTESPLLASVSDTVYLPQQHTDTVYLTMNVEKALTPVAQENVVSQSQTELSTASATHHEEVEKVEVDVENLLLDPQHPLVAGRGQSLKQENLNRDLLVAGY